MSKEVIFDLYTFCGQIIVRTVAQLMRCTRLRPHLIDLLGRNPDVGMTRHPFEAHPAYCAPA